MNAETASRLRTPQELEGKLAYVRLNIQTPCPPRGAVPVNQGRLRRYFTLTARIAFGYGCDCFSYVASLLSRRPDPEQAETAVNAKARGVRAWLLAMLLAISFAAFCSAKAELVIKTSEPKTYGKKTIIKMELHNTFSNKIQSVRAVVFLLDDKGKVVGQETRWIIGGTKDRLPLPADGKATYNFVVQYEKPFTRSKVTITKLLFQNGGLGDLNRDVRIETP
jgi:hypothetical protein